MGVAARRGPITAVPQPVLTGLLVPDADEMLRPLAAPRREQLSVRDMSAWARVQVGRIARLTHTDRSSELMVYSQAAKLVEEVGELHAELLGRSKRQRASKSRAFDDDSLQAELADVVLATAVLAEILDIDLRAAIVAKIAIIDARAAAERQLPI